MEFWFVLAIISAVFIWLNEFIKKIISKEWLNKNWFLLYLSLMQLIISLVYYIYIGSYFYMTLLFWVLIIVRIVLVVEKISTMIESLKYIDTSLFFPVNKFIRLIGWFFVWSLIFWEYLNNSEYIFIIIWLISILFLGYKKWSHKNSDFKKWIFFLLLSSLILVWTSTINKFISENHDIALYMLLSNIVWLIYILIKIRLNSKKFLYNKKELFYWFISWIIWFIGFGSLLYSLWNWKLVIVQTIAMLSIFIPIILSFIFLWENINRYKLMWLGLFIINLWIFYLNK